MAESPIAWGAALSLNFNGDGYLAAGLHPLDEAQFEATFVTSFPHSTTRGDILVGYRRHAGEITAIVGDCEQYVDGSFVTNKNDPGDVDLLMLIDASVVDAIPPHLKPLFKALVAGKLTKATHHCDAYYCPVYPETHPAYEQGRQQRKYWMGEFGYDRKDVPKGIVQRTLTAPATLPPLTTPPSTATP